ncbi:MAG: type II toxin-antitoxin system VapC family toxin [Anaerolineaceae bacterium]|nr:type II toxin-antitoxin system VapC family toxin [Anaerolineaceae bacterium]
MNYFLDTNICIYIINKRPPSIVEKLMQFSPQELGISAIVVSELQYGVAKSSQSERNRQLLDAFLRPFQIVPYDTAAAEAYGFIRADLEKKGQPIGREDLLIAAHALSADLTLVTNNEAEFKRVPNLRVENWAA